MTKISIVIPVLNERENAKPLFDEIIDVLQAIDTASYEVIFVDDGSTDGTFDVLTTLHELNPHIIVLQFRRNFGKSAALSAGFAEADGEVVFTMDGDLQDNPVEIPRFLAKLDEGYDLVSGWKYPRLDPLTKTFPSKLWNLLLRMTTGVNLHDFNCGFKAYRRDVVQDMQLYGELYRYIPVLADQKGYRVTEIQVAHRPRLHGTSKFGFKRFGRGFFDLLTILFLGTYSWRPLHLFGGIGGGVSVAGSLVLIYLTVLWLMGDRPIGNRPLLTLGVLLVTVGVQFLSIGLLAEMFALINAQNTQIYSVRRRLD